MSLDIKKMGDAVEFSMDARVRILAESVWTAARREYRKEVIEIVEWMVKSTSDTGYGKAQRRFARMLVSNLKEN